VSLSIYIHTPFCLQRCRYCDFTTFESHEIYPPEEYFKDLHREISHRHHLWKDRHLQSIYFGGGTPSLVDPKLIVATLQALANAGFHLPAEAEVTIEINPATLTEKSLEQYLSAGINRFSVGAQSFNDRLLKLCGRKHDAEDTRNTLRLLKKRDLNYSFDLLFALPHQSVEDLEKDLQEILEWRPPHLSTYCLTVPEGHPMSFHRPEDEEQIEMFELIEKTLAKIELYKYELSNFARPGFESVHNGCYWKDQAFWGIGLSSHSYAPDLGPFGTRFWNTKSVKRYPEEVKRQGPQLPDLFSEDQRETLAQHEAMTDFCHMYLRTLRGLPLEALQKFDSSARHLLRTRFQELIQDGLLTFTESHYRLTEEGQLKSNLVYRHLTFLKDEVNDAVH